MNEATTTPALAVYTPGSKLPNGATVLLHVRATNGHGTVLAVVDAQLSKGVEYVTWDTYSHNRAGACDHGHYFPVWRRDGADDYETRRAHEARLAIDDLVERIARHGGPADPSAFVADVDRWRGLIG